MAGGREAETNMAKATGNGTVLAESDRWEIVENNLGFLPEAVWREYPEDSRTRTECAWIGYGHVL